MLAGKGRLTVTWGRGHSQNGGKRLYKTLLCARGEAFVWFKQDRSFGRLLPPVNLHQSNKYEIDHRENLPF